MASKVSGPTMRISSLMESSSPPSMKYGRIFSGLPLELQLEQGDEVAYRPSRSHPVEQHLLRSGRLGSLSKNL